MNLHAGVFIAKTFKSRAMVLVGNLQNVAPAPVEGRFRSGIEKFSRPGGWDQKMNLDVASGCGNAQRVDDRAQEIHAAAPAQKAVSQYSQLHARNFAGTPT